ncbi:MAG: 23S rRNA (uridine(2552)-2'-O)-methyltransferase [Methanobacterium sp.]|uniref:RlmE family RNA methyltransferase n=1 Tax=Methanobacterium sp. TaxID=2164 RepID=UPI003D64DD06|nr:23S rRNA (uridine(2552)-2'-O)-methyltransferase [Methanobacterium sp.]
MGKRWEVEKKKEHYYKMAKKEKYRSRASYKLLQLNKKFKIIKPRDYVVDLGAAPGGWSQVALDLIGEEGMVIAVDLQRIRPFEQTNFVQITGDFTEKETIDKIEETLEWNADVLLSDAAPKLTGITDIDQLKSVDIAENALKISDSILKIGGNFIIKLFQGEGFEEFLKKVKKKFNNVKTTKPPSSKKGSTEMYIIAMKKK